MKVAIVGGSLSGNKGAASMVLGLIDALPNEQVVVLTPSPATDTDEDTSDVGALVGFGPVDIVLADALPLVARLTAGRIATPALRAPQQADVVADVSGISFVDGRGFATLAYNVLLLLPALLLGTPVVKISQAMGPLRRPTTRIAGRLLLPRIHTVLARGDRTVAHLDELGLRHGGLVPDSAFLMEVRPADEAWAAARVDGLVQPVVLAPSQVVVGQADDDGAGYIATMAALLDHLTTTRDVLVLAHSARPMQPAGRLNDIPLCEQLVAGAARPERCHLVADGSPRQLRALMASTDLVVASRFHAMISALATATPVLVVGWSHKYAEVLRAFGHEELAIDHRAVATEPLLASVDTLLEGRDALAAELALALVAVAAAARANATAVITAAT
jgi:colanic acid/amylovoran biosynthesis protein